MERGSHLDGIKDFLCFHCGKKKPLFFAHNFKKIYLENQNEKNLAIILEYNTKKPFWHYCHFKPKETRLSVWTSLWEKKR